MKELEAWVTRDEDGLLYLIFGRKPEKTAHSWYNWSKDYYEIKASLFPEVKWLDEEPTKVKLVIEK